MCARVCVWFFLICRRQILPFFHASKTQLLFKLLLVIVLSWSLQNDYEVLAGTVVFLCLLSDVESGLSYLYWVEAVVGGSCSQPSPFLNYTHGQAFCGDGNVDRWVAIASRPLSATFDVSILPSHYLLFYRFSVTLSVVDRQSSHFAVTLFNCFLLYCT